MRLFVAAEIAREVAEAAGVVIAELRHRAGRLAPRSKITWVVPDRLHITIAFIGSSDEEQTRGICDALATSVAVEPFDLTIAGLGAFPRTGQPRVLWAGLTEGREALGRVEDVVATRLAGFGLAREPRAYNPHLTVARVREAAGLRAAALLDGLADRTIGTTRVDAITLFDSRLSSTGPTYEPLRRIALHA
jgi:2'-5' RNA ligase